MTILAKSGHIVAAVSALLDLGCKLLSAPSGGILPRNKLLIEIGATDGTRRWRLLIYKVTSSGRNRDWERRIEITTTYQGNLKRERGFGDVVLGYDSDHDIFIGIDPIRLKHGGPTHNASSFVDADGLEWKDAKVIEVRTRPTDLRPSKVEYQAFVKPPCLLEYLRFCVEIHRGDYTANPVLAQKAYRKKDRYRDILVVVPKETPGLVTMSAPKRARQTRRDADEKLVRQYEQTGGFVRGGRSVSPATLKSILRRCEEYGRIGERYVLDAERKRLRRSKKPELARRVAWVSQDSVSEGYDILSFETDGSPRHIEVKATSGDGMVFFMSDGEWKAAVALTTSYYVYRVINVTNAPAIARELPDPVELEKKGILVREANGYRVVVVAE